MKRNSVVSVAVAVGAFAVVGAPGALGQVVQHVVVGGGLPDINLDDNTLRASPLSVAATWTNNIYGHTGSASATAWGQYGVLRASAHAQNTGIGDAMYRGGYAGATSSFTDTITINAANPLLQGTAGSFTASIDFNGTWSAGFLGPDVFFNGDDERFPSIGAGLEVRKGFSTVFDVGTGLLDYHWGAGPWTASGGASGPNIFTVDFVFGQSFHLSVFLNVQAAP